MRTRQVALLVAPALCSALALAAPSFDSFNQQQPLVKGAAQYSRPSRWRSFTDSILESIWPPERHCNDRAIDASSRPLRDIVPSHSLARYDGDIVLRFNISTAEEAESMAEAADTLLLDVWEFSKYWVDVRLAKDLVPSLLGLLPESLQSSHTPLLLERDLVKAIYDTYPSPPDQQSTQPTVPPSHIRDRPFGPSLNPNGAETNIFFSDYQPFSVIQPWLRLLSSLFTTHVRLINIGTSYQGRAIPGLRVGVHPTNSEDPEPKKRKTVVVAGGLHAREWIGTSTVNYVAYRMITGYGKNPRITRLLEDFDFVFIPTLNPDGYVYTWETDRLWRKNRQQTNVRFCPGIDLDRGFGYQWDGLKAKDGASIATTTTGSNPCSESFAGETPFEATESRRLADWARNETEHNNVEFIGFLDLHSYSQEILYPYSYTCEPRAPGQENLEELALGLEKTIRVSSGQIYEVMAACEGNVASRSSGGKKKDEVMLPRIEDGGGSALDWFAHEMGVHYAYQIKLRDRGTYGFLLPRENIIPTGSEIWEAVMYFAGFLSEVYISESSNQHKGVENVEMTKPEFGSDIVVGEDGEDGVALAEMEEDKATSSNEEAVVDVEEEVVDGETYLEADDEPWILVEDVGGEDFNQDLKRQRRR